MRLFQPRSASCKYSKDDGFLCQSGYAANVGLLQAVADAQTPVYLDTLAHKSLWEGVHAARAGLPLSGTTTRRLRASLSELGYPIDQGSEQIIALEVGLECDTMALRDRLEARGVFGAMFCAPATSSKRAMMRLTLSAALMDSELDHVEAAARELAPLVKPWDWPIARRARRNFN